MQSTGNSVRTRSASHQGLQNLLSPDRANIYPRTNFSWSTTHEPRQSQVPLSHMAALLNMRWVSAVEDDRSFDCQWLQFRPGETIYTPQSTCNQAYIVLTGPVLRLRQREEEAAFGAPGQCAFASCHELIGLHVTGKARTESAVAIFDTEVLGLPIEAMRRVPGINALFSEWVIHPLSVAMMRDWQVACRLRGLPSYARLVAGLAHLSRLAMAGKERHSQVQADHQCLTCSIGTPVLANWLDLRIDDVNAELRKLERYHLISLDTRGDRVIEVDVHTLAQLSSIVLRHGRHAADGNDPKF